MNKNLLVYPTKDMSEEAWLLFRTRGIGASDVGTILKLNQWKSRIELFYEKISTAPVYSLENIAKFMGKYDEPKVADLWQYWDGSEEGMIKNYRAKKIIRKCQKVNAYIVNPKYPWLFVSLDRKINKTKDRGEGALELKTVNGREADKFEAGINQQHITQVQTQVVVGELEFGEMATLTDGRFFDLWPLPSSPTMQDIILHETKIFWDKVVEGRKLETQKYEAIRSHNMRLANDLDARIVALEPEPDGSAAYEAFLKKKFKKSLAQEGLVKGTPEMLEQARLLKLVKDDIKQLEDEARFHENTLKRAIGDGRILDFGKDGTVKWDGEPRRFYNGIKKEANAA